MNVEKLQIKDLREGFRKKEFSATEITKAFLKRIEEKDKEINAFVTVSSDVALSSAKAVDEKIARNEELPLLAGIPCSVKDSILVQGVRCTAGSRMLEDYIAPYDASVIKKIKNAGGIIVGKTNTDEFGMGGSTENSAFGPTRNPHDPTKVAGGSSGGSAAAVAAGECVVSLGEDTGGSIRLPASFCGVVGLKPTYGAVSRYGVIALASSLDQIGPIGKTVEEVELLFDAIKGKDPFDSTSVEINSKFKIQNSKLEIQNLRIGVPKEYFTEGLDPAVEKVIRSAIQKLQDTGATIEEITLPHVKYALAVYYIINTSESSANLARYDGLRYGLSKDQKANIKNLFDAYLENRGQGFGPEVKRRIMLGTFALSAGYYEAYYVKAQKIRTLLQQDFEHAFQKVDVIAGPVSPVLPFTIGERIGDPLAMYLVDIYTVPVNLTGLPGLSVPIGKAGNLPVGLQLISRAFQEDFLFATGKLLEEFSSQQSAINNFHA